MNILETVRTAFAALKGNKIRTALTMLGIIIGVFSVILLVSLVRGVQNYVTDQFNSIGSNLVFVMPGRFGFNRDPATMFTDNKLSTKQVDILQNQEASYIQYATPINADNMAIKYKNQQFYATVSGAYPNYTQMLNVSLQSGRFFDDTDESAQRKVILLGSNVAKNLFTSKNAIGETVKVGTSTFEVIGVLQPKSQDFDDSGIVPFTTAKSTLGMKNIVEIIAKIKDGENIDEDTKKIQNALLRDLKRDDFSVNTAKDILQSIQSILQILSFGLGAVAAISLIVGGIGIMNIMLVAVTERIKEIGLRKALGATSRGIATQFLLEAIILSLSGGFIGLTLGFLASLAARRFIRTEVPLWALLVSVGFSLLVGVVFGTYPAFKASKKDPIEALRYE